MMDYRLFKTVFVKRIGDYMPGDFKKYKAVTKTVRKVNKAKDGFYMMPPDAAPGVPMPTIYLDDIYEDFCMDEDLNRVLSKAAYILTAYSGGPVTGEDVTDYESMKDKVVMNLINREMNGELLKDLPHRDFMDLAIIYRVVFRRDDNGIMSLMITENVMKDMGVDEEGLYRLARENTRRIFPAKFMVEEGPLYIMTNDAVINGATTMLYKEEMRQLSEKIGGDFYILPTSIHEFFALPPDRTDPWKMAAMLAGGNGTVTDWSEVLSRSIYSYSAESGSLSICATCIEGGQKSKVTETEMI